jgi:hypothetical protein
VREGVGAWYDMRRAVEEEGVGGRRDGVDGRVGVAEAGEDVRGCSKLVLVKGIYCENG